MYAYLCLPAKHLRTNPHINSTFEKKTTVRAKEMKTKNKACHVYPGHRFNPPLPAFASECRDSCAVKLDIIAIDGYCNNVLTEGVLNDSKHHKTQITLIHKL